MHRGKDETQGGGAEAERKSEVKAGAKRRGQGGAARNTMGMGYQPGTQHAADGAMGHHQSTGDGGSSDFDTGS